MEGQYHRNRHRPFHLYGGHTYFVTGRWYGGKRYMRSDVRKEVWKAMFRESIKRFHIRLYSWVLLDNHYHILFSLPQAIDVANDSTETDFVLAQSVTPRTEKARSDEMSEENFVTLDGKYTLVEFIRKLHKDSARSYNKQDNTPGRKVWYQYWDYCIRNKADFWKHFNYIVKNPFKHGLVDSLSEAYTYPFSSNPVWLNRFGVDGLWESFVRYPVAEVFSNDE